MMKFARLSALALMIVTLLAPIASRADDALIQDRYLGKADAPITVEEFVSLTCSHCAEFYNDILPELEKKYVDTGKVRFILRDFPLDGVGLKAAALARCMPADEYYPFIKTLYSSQKTWIASAEPDKALLQYARLGGLSDDKAQACIKDTKLMDAIIAERTDADQHYKVEATPTFVMNGGAETIKGALPAATFSAAFDRILAAKK